MPLSFYSNILLQLPHYSEVLHSLSTGACVGGSCKLYGATVIPGAHQPSSTLPSSNSMKEFSTFFLHSVVSHTPTSLAVKFPQKLEIGQPRELDHGTKICVANTTAHVVVLFTRPWTSHYVTASSVITWEGKGLDHFALDFEPSQWIIAITITTLWLTLQITFHQACEILFPLIAHSMNYCILASLIFNCSLSYICWTFNYVPAEWT